MLLKFFVIQLRFENNKLCYNDKFNDTNVSVRYSSTGNISLHVELYKSWLRILQHYFSNCHTINIKNDTVYATSVTFKPRSRSVYSSQ